jgi:hypothetical protein
MIRAQDKELVRAAEGQDGDGERCKKGASEGEGEEDGRAHQVLEGELSPS